jgi:hypothetical protein
MTTNSMHRIWFFGLTVLAPGAMTSAQTPQEPRSVLETYCKLDADGTQLKPRGWLQLARMCIPQEEPRPGLIKVSFDKLEIIRGFTIGNVIMEGTKAARLTVRYSSLGKFDYDSLATLGKFDPDSLAFSATGERPPTESSDAFRLVLTTTHFDLDSRGYGVLVTGPESWRIEGVPHTPHITIEAAIGVVVKLRGDATSEEFKANADRAIAALTKLKASSKGEKK